jgi:hypothetical protein
LYGDRSGSPRRDDRQYGTPWDADIPPYGGDVKVAGAPVAGRPGNGTPPVTHVEYVPASQVPVGEHVSTAEATGYDGEAGPGATTAFEREAYPSGTGTEFEGEAYPAGQGLDREPYPAGFDGAPGQGPGDAYGEATVRLGDAGYGETAYLPQGESEVTRDDLAPVPEFGTAGRGGPRGSSTRRIKVLGVAVAVTVAGGGVIGGWVLTAGSGHEEAADRGPVQAQGPAPLTDAQRKAAEARRLRELKERASRAAREDDSKPMLFAKGQPPETKKPEIGLGDPTPVGEAQQIARAMLPDFGWKPSQQFGCLVNLWDKESHWNTHASSPTGAYGIPQALPGSKMASAGPDWQNSARTQIKWGLGYVQDRYGTPCGAWQHSVATGWY